MKIKVFTAFSGYDSQCMALDMLKEKHPDFDYELVGWSEIDRYACQMHDVFYPQWSERNYGDISKIDWVEVPDFDLFTFSFPCQSISNAGLQHGFAEGSGTRSSLLWECKKAIDIKRPKMLLMENVKALVQKKFMPDFQKWLDYLESKGYTNYWQVTNAKDYGIPQNRERVFCVSFLVGGRNYVFPSPRKLDKVLRDMLDPEDTIPLSYYLPQEKVDMFCKINEKKIARGDGFRFAPTDLERVSKCLRGGGDGAYSDPKWIKIEAD